MYAKQVAAALGLAEVHLDDSDCKLVSVDVGALPARLPKQHAVPR